MGFASMLVRTLLRPGLARKTFYCGVDSTIVSAAISTVAGGYEYIRKLQAEIKQLNSKHDCSFVLICTEIKIYLQQ